MSRTTGIRIAVDIGGTFTDIVLDNEASLDTAKTLTTRQGRVLSVELPATRLERRR